MLERAIKLINEFPEDPQPVKLMLLDNNMPRIMGIQVIKMLRKFITEENKSRAVKVKEPMFVIITAFVSPLLSSFLAAENIEQLVFEKPLQKEEISAILHHAFSQSELIKFL